MNYKRRKSSKHGRCYSGSMGPKDSGGDGWRRGNHSERFRAFEHGRRHAALEDMDVEEQTSIRVVLDETDDRGGYGIELYRIPIDPDCRLGAMDLLRKVREVVSGEGLVRGTWLSTRHNDVEVRIDHVIDQVKKKKGIEAVKPLVEGIVSSLAEVFADMSTAVVPELFCCPKCLKDITAGFWDYASGKCQSCVWDEMEKMDLYYDYLYGEDEDE